MPNEKIRLSIDVSLEFRNELKLFVGLNPGMSMQSVVINEVTNMLQNQARIEGSKYSAIADKSLLKLV